MTDKATPTAGNVAQRNAKQAEPKEPAHAHGPGIVRVNHVPVAVRIEMVVTIESASQRKKCQRRRDEARLRVRDLRAALIVERHVVVGARVHGLERGEQRRLSPAGKWKLSKRKRS